MAVTLRLGKAVSDKLGKEMSYSSHFTVPVLSAMFLSSLLSLFLELGLPTKN